MKKTLAAVSASILGLAGSLGASAAPASAALPSCGDATLHVVNPTVVAGDDWYMTCIPQYGLGKVEFTINPTSGNTFPAGYSLVDGHQTITSTPTAAALETYFGPFYDVENSGTPPFSGALLDLFEDPGSTPTSQSYGNTNTVLQAYPIVSVAKVTSGFPAACTSDTPTPSYQGEFVITYGPVTTTFTETVADTIQKVTVTSTPAPMYLGLNYDTAVGGVDGFDTLKPLCASSGGLTSYAASAAANSISWNLVAAGAATNDPGYLTTLDPATGFDLVNGVPPVSNDGAFTVTSDPVLPETGVNAVPAGILGGSLLLAGIGAFVFGRRRRAGAHRG
jgi:LPXTG-motif cell wall-anchored protein